MKHLLISTCIAAACFVVPAPLRAAETTVHFTSGETIPDDDTTGLADNRIVHSGITQLTEVEVHLEIAGGWNGDLYAHLVHDDGYSVLLNRSGRTESSGAGSSASGFDITLSDNAVTDVHVVESAGTVSGLLQPAARDVNPQLSLDTSPRTDYLSSFQGLPASGEWTLFLVDASGGNVSTLVSWGLTLRGTGTPQSFYGEWAAGLIGDDGDLDASPQGDGLKNLLKYAFNLDPLRTDARRLVPGADDPAGLPAQQIVRGEGTISLTLEFLRRRDTGLIYTPKRSPDLSPSSFVPMIGEEIVETIDANWERVWVTEILDAATHPRMFCTVDVQYP